MPIVSFTDVPALGQMFPLAVKILLLVLTVDLVRESISALRGRPADFVAVASRGVVAAVIVSVIPWASVQLAEIVLAVSGYLFERGNTDMMNRAFVAAFGSFTCDISGWEAMGLFFSKAGLLLLLGQLMVLVVMLVKFFVIDVAWPIVFCLVVYLGVLTVPLSVIPQMGGIWTYVRAVLAVAMWPVVFGFLMVLMAAIFPQTLEAVATGDIKISCEMVEKVPVPAGGPVSSGLATAVENEQGRVALMAGANSADLDKPDDFKGVLRFLAICLGAVMLTLRTPAISAALLGQPDMGSGLTTKLLTMMGRQTPNRSGSTPSKSST